MADSLNIIELSGALLTGIGAVWGAWRIDVKRLEARFDGLLAKKDVAIAELIASHAEELRKLEREHDRTVAKLNGLLVHEARTYAGEAVKLAHAINRIETITTKGGG